MGLPAASAACLRRGGWYWEPRLSRLYTCPLFSHWIRCLQAAGGGGGSRRAGCCWQPAGQRQLQ
ncbi:hypothetical protein DV515_00011376 [Chloebia gouldiae]|uniref:Uncharacterized protein n=1 Tax=Chloebia gouldiae TaxID=44316 RepID=A0A3L8S6H8_CHLGU|nr:hypothetical protein DV515_00011376 [Chloebia gouldiae]